jgi:hypothetical protein
MKTRNILIAIFTLVVITGLGIGYGIQMKAKNDEVKSLKQANEELKLKVKELKADAERRIAATEVDLRASAQKLSRSELKKMLSEKEKIEVRYSTLAGEESSISFDRSPRPSRGLRELREEMKVEPHEKIIFETGELTDETLQNFDGSCMEVKIYKIFLTVNILYDRWHVEVLIPFCDGMTVKQAYKKGKSLHEEQLRESSEAAVTDEEQEEYRNRLLTFQNFEFVKQPVRDLEFGNLKCWKETESKRENLDLNDKLKHSDTAMLVIWCDNSYIP